MKLAGFFVLLLIGSGFEVFGVGIILPFVRMLEDPQYLLENDKFQLFAPWLEGFSDNKLIVISGIVLLFIYILKNSYLTWAWYKIYEFFHFKTADLSCRLFSEYINKPYVFHIQSNSSDLIRNTTDETRRVVTGLLLKIVRFGADSMVMIGLVGLLIAVEPISALGGLVLMGAIGWGMTVALKRKFRQIGEAKSREHSGMIRWVKQGIEGIKEIKVLGRESYVEDKFARRSYGLADVRHQRAFFSKLPRRVVEPVFVSLIVLLVVSLVMLRSGLGNVLPIVALFGAATIRLIPSITSVVTTVNNLRFNAPAIDIIFEDLKDEKKHEREPVESGEEFRFQDTLGLNHLTYRYPGASENAIDDMTLEIERGQSVAFVGLSGAGKTTLVNLLLGLLQPTSGEIQIDDVDYQEHLRAWQRQLGYIPQEIYAIDDTIRKNVAFGVPEDEIDEGAVWQALEAAQVASFVRGLKNGIDTQLGERGVRISGGQRQRIGIARALYRNPEVLVFDEATSSLDYETERRVTEAINQLVGRKTLIIITHRLNTVRECDTIHVLSDGKLVGSGTYEELLARNEEFQKLVQVNEASSPELEDAVPKQETSL